MENKEEGSWGLGLVCAALVFFCIGSFAYGGALLGFSALLLSYLLMVRRACPKLNEAQIEATALYWLPRVGYEWGVDRWDYCVSSDWWILHGQFAEGNEGPEGLDRRPNFVPDDFVGRTAIPPRSGTWGLPCAPNSFPSHLKALRCPHVGAEVQSQVQAAVTRIKHPEARAALRRFARVRNRNPARALYEIAVATGMAAVN